MRISNPRAQQFLQQYKKKTKSMPSDQPMTELPKDKIQVSIRKNKTFKVAENNPEDPTVSTKVLDGLSMGMINFSQKERDVLATIMSDKANKVEK